MQKVHFTKITSVQSAGPDLQKQYLHTAGTHIFLHVFQSKVPSTFNRTWSSDVDVDNKVFSRTLDCRPTLSFPTQCTNGAKQRGGNDDTSAHITIALTTGLTPEMFRVNAHISTLGPRTSVPGQKAPRAALTSAHPPLLSKGRYPNECNY